MKKLFTLCMFLLTTASMMAEDSNTFQFTDKDGNAIENGATVTVKTPVTDAFGEVILPSGIYVKNVSAGDAGIRIHYTIETLENGTFQICFPVSCITKNATGDFVTDSDLMSSGQSRDLQSEWLPNTYGQCKVTYQIEVMTQTQILPPKFEPKEMGSKITVLFTYADPAGIEETTGNNNHQSVIARYSLNGRKLEAPHHGIVIERLSNGQTIKTLHK